MQDRRSFARTTSCAAPCVCALAVLLLLQAAPLFGQSFSQRFLSASQKRTRGETVSTTPHPAIARIIVPEKDGISYGSGSLIDVRDDFGLVITNWHVVRDASGNISVLFPDGFSSKADVVKVDKDWDLAALSIRRPPIDPLPMSAQPPREGERLTIAGYGSGDFRAAAGKCLGYNSPEQGLPAELVEVDAEARHGDSGGPIFNERGEIAGVLFGTNGTTHGSYGGRVIGFLSSVLPGGAFAKAPPLPANTIPQVANSPAESHESPHITSDPDPLFAVTEPDSQLSAMSLNPSRSGAEPAGSSPPKLLSAPPHEQPLVPIPGARNETSAPALIANRPAPEVTTPEDGSGETRGDDSGERVASSQSSFAAADSSSLSRLRPAQPDKGEDASAALKLLGQAWQKLGGETLWDQTKAVLALIGLLALFVKFWRMGSQSEPIPQEE